MDIFHTKLFDHQENKKNKKCFIYEEELKNLPELHERDEDYPLAPEVMKIKF